MFFRSQSAPEQDHMVEALRFELGKLERLPIRQRMVAMLNLVNEDLAARVAEGLGFAEIPPMQLPINHSVPADGDPTAFEPRRIGKTPATSPALSMLNTVRDTIATRRVAILAADGVDTASLRQVKEALERAGAAAKVIAPRLGTLKGADGTELLIDHSLLTASSVLFDAVYVPGGAASVEALIDERDAIEFIVEAFRHCKAIAATGEGLDLLRACPGVLKGDGDAAEGVITSKDAASPDVIARFTGAIAQHRFWNRARKNRVKAAPKDDTRGRALTN